MLIAWLSIKINLFSFILLLINNSTTNEIEASIIDYFLPQALGSILFLTSSRIILNFHWFHEKINIPITIAIAIKLGIARRCTRSVHAVNGRVHGHIHGTYTAVHTGRKHGRVHGHGRTMYIARAWPCTQSVHGRGRPCTDWARPPSAVYKLCTRPYTGHAHGPSVSRTRPCTQPVRGKTRPGTRPVPDCVRTVYMAVHVSCTVYTAVFTARVHGHVRTMYTALHGPSMTRTRRVHGRVPCTRPCLRPVYAAVYRVHARVCGLCIRPSTYRLRTGHVHGPFMSRTRRCPAHGRVYGPCRVHGRSRANSHESIDFSEGNSDKS